MRTVKLERILSFFALFILLVSATNCGHSKRGSETVMEDTTIVEPRLVYGLPADSFVLETGVIKKNQYLSRLLNDNGVAMNLIDKIVKNSDTIFDVRKIRGGKNYTFFYSCDSNRQARYFVYENSPVEYFVYELFDSLRVYRGEKEIKVRHRTAKGEIQSSLWNTMKDNGLDPLLAIELSDIFQWTIDFYAIQKGDRFKVIYDELYVDSIPIGIGEIHAAEFDHYEKPNFAFHFIQNDTVGYYDENGENLQKQFLKAPLKFSRISSRFSNSRLHPVLRIRRPHHGVDYAAPKGTPVRSIGDGTVIAKAYQRRGGGKYLKIRHNSVYTTLYMHLNGFAKGIAQGVRVKQGQVIGYVGSTGLSTGPHLDFRVFKNGKPVDPLKVKSPPAEPVTEASMPQFIALKDSLMNQLLLLTWDKDTVALVN